MDLRDDVLKALEEARNAKTIGKSLEAKVTLFVKDEYKSLFESDEYRLCSIIHCFSI